MPFKRDLGVAIIGAGMSGICMAAKLQGRCSAADAVPLFIHLLTPHQ